MLPEASQGAVVALGWKQARQSLCDKVMDGIAEYIVKYDVRGQGLVSAASDVCDGWVSRFEIQPLLDGRRLKLVGRPYEMDEVCGDEFRYWTVQLTKREIERRWKDRIAAPAVKRRGKKQ